MRADPEESFLSIGKVASSLKQDVHPRLLLVKLQSAHPGKIWPVVTVLQ